MTLTTERLREIASSPSFSANPLSHEVKYMARELLAKREAQPVAAGKFAGYGLYNAERDEFGSWLKPTPQADCSDAITKHGYVNVKLFTAPPAPAVVKLPTEFYSNEGIVVRLEQVMAALAVGGVQYERKANAKTRCEFPSSEVPEEMTGGIAMSKHKVKKSNYAQWVKGWNACRAAMLAQPVSGGYKLVPAEATEDMIAAAMNCDDVSFNADETFCVNFGNIYAAMLAAAPKGGNDHDTRR